MPGLLLTPEEEAQLQSPSATGGLNPIRDFSADDLFQLAITDEESFHPIISLRQNKELWKDPAIVQKVADVQARIKQRGFTFEDFPSVGEAATAVGGFFKGLGKQAWNFASALVVNPVLSAVGEITGQGPGFTTELAQQGQRQLLENLTAIESSQFQMGRLGQKTFDKITRKTSAPSTPEERVKNLWDDVKLSEAEEAVRKGGSGFLIPESMTSEVRKELEVAGKPIREKEVEALAPGDPVAFWTYGKLFEGVGRGIKAGAAKVAERLPAKTVAAVEKVPVLAEKTAEKVAGRTIQAAGTLTELGGRAVKIAAPAVGMVKGAIEAGPLGALAGLKGGEIVSKIGGKISKGGKAIAESGKEIAGAAPVAGGVTQLVKDVIGGVPVMATEIGKGLAFDIGTAAVSSESPQDTKSVGIGAFFGGLGAARRVGSRVISGQLVGPRAWGSDKATYSSGKFPGLDTMHAEAVKAAAPAVQTRLNAIRQFLKGSHADTDVFLAKDAQAVENAMLQTGASPEQARQFSQTEGFFLTSLPDAQGNPRRVIIARNVDAAPHESFHAIQDVLGETANQHIDQIVREEYGPTWEQEGQRYAARIGPGEWREVVLDSTGTGLNYAKEKIAMDVANEYRASTGAEPPSGFVQDRVKAILGQVMDRAVQANPDVTPNDIARHAWRDILSPQEATAVADSYLARELAAENFDMVFKRGGGESGLTGRLARIVAQLVSTLGGEPLSPERPSQIGEIAPRFRVTEAVREAPELVQPRDTKPEILPITPREPLPTTPPTQPPPADEARKIAAAAPETSTVAGTASPREILGNVAEAIAQQAGLKVNYLSAPGEGPAASISSNRDARRAVIEAFRTMPPEARALWEKNFFPDRVVKLKGDKYQILGWAPEVFAANAHKLAAKLTELGVADASPYPVKEGTFTPEGWQELFKDVQTFVKNQMGGRTGAGESLVVPRDITERGFYAPPIRGKAELLPQLKADFINMLFGFKLPDTARVQKGKLPLNLAGQAVSEATQPGRTEIPVIPRGRFEGAEAERQGIAGRDIMEVNPLRQQIEAAAQAKGVAMPEFIEAQQRLNLENIKNVEVAPELSEFRGNTLTLSAGFQPSAEARAVKSAAVKDERGKLWEGFAHGDAENNARMAGARGPFDDGFTTNGGEFLTREAAFERAKELKQIPEGFDPLEGTPGLSPEAKPFLESSEFEAARLETSQLPKAVRDAAVDKAMAAKFQPPKDSEIMFRPGWLSPEGKFFSLGEFPTHDHWAVANIDNLTNIKVPNNWTGTSIELLQRNNWMRFVPFSPGSSAIVDSGRSRKFPTKLQRNALEDWATRDPGLKKIFLDRTLEGTGGSEQPEVIWSRDAEAEVGGARFQPPKNSEQAEELVKSIAKMSPKDFDNWAHETPGGLTEAAYQTGLNSATQGFVNLLKAASESFGKKAESLVATDVEAAMVVATQQQFFNEAWQAATGEGSAGYSLRKKDPNFQPKFPLDRTATTEDTVAQMQPEKDKSYHRVLKEMSIQPSMRKEYAEAADFLDNGFTKEEWEALPYANQKLVHSVAQFKRDWASPFGSNKNDRERRHPFSKRAAMSMFDDIPDFESRDTSFKGIREAAEAGEIPPVQFQPKKELKLKPAGRDGFSKTWVLPDGNIVNIGGQWHHEYLNDNPELRKQYKLSADTSEDNRIEALNKGFVRMNWNYSNGELTIEARTKDWPKQREAIRNFVEANADSIDRMQVVLMSDNLKKVDDAHEESVFMLEDNEKSAMLPFGDLGDKRATGQASDRLFEKAASKAQLQPALESELEKIRKGESSGQTFTSIGEVWTPGDKPVDIVTVASINVPTKDLTAEKYAEAIAPYAELLEDPNVVAGVFSLGPETTSIDINAVVPQEHRENTKAFAKANDQMSIWDAVKFETVETGGTGETKLKSIPQIKAALSSLTQGEPVSVEDIAAQFQPRSAEKDLFGFEEKLSIREIAKLPPERLQEIYPEALVPEDINETIPSAIIESPLYEKAGSEDAAVKAFSDGLVKFAQTVRQDPVAKAGAEWYTKFTPELKKEFGKDAQLMAELLAATSPNTGVETNFKFALDALDSFKSGRFTKIMTKFNQGMDMVANDTWKSWYNKELKNIPEPPKKPTAATFLEHWIYKHDLKPRQSNGKLYGIHSLPVLQVFARKWLSAARGPKTLNFIENLMGQSHEATIDVWADRTMRRLGYAGEDRWRILPKNVRPVSDPDFEFAQKAFRHAANRLGMKPSALQGMLWFAEKKYWAERGWADLNLGDFRAEMEKIPALRAKRLTLIEKSGKIPSKQLELK